MLVLADEFTKSGIKVDLILAHRRGEYLEKVPDMVNLIDLNASRMIFAVPKLARSLRASKPDVLLTTIELANILAYLVKPLAGGKIPWVLRQANHPSERREENALKNFIYHLLLIRAFRTANHIIAVSKASSKEIIKLARVPDNRITCIYNPSFVLDQNTKTEETVDDDWFSGAHPVVMSAGRLEPVKDFPTLIKSFALVHRQSPMARLVIFGTGSQRRALEELVTQLQLEDAVKLPGFAANLMPFIRRADVFVLSSRSEGFPNVLVEAMLGGCAVISTDCPGGAREIVNDGKFGHLVPVGDPAAMAEAIIEVLNGKKKQVPPLWAEQFRPERIALEYIKVFETLWQYEPRSAAGFWKK